ncbi:MAG TPA: ABC transporter permease subunit [Candidatus Obscuribacterales bacterium]
MRPLFLKEIREVTCSKAFWLMMLVLCPLVGYSFVEAVDLYGEASKSVIGEELAVSRMAPLDGILVPTFSSLYLVVTFLFPFVAIRILGSEKQFGSLKLLLQSSASSLTVVTVKAAVLLLFWFFTLIPGLCAIFFWHQLGGHIYLPETVCLIAGHFLYALLVAAIGLFSVAITESAQTAAIVTLSFTISSLILEFAASNPGAARYLSFLSMTAWLRQFESGIFALPVFLGFLVTAAAFLCLAAVWITPGNFTSFKLKQSIAVGLVAGALAGLSSNAFWYGDYSEHRRNSFSPAAERALKKLTHPLKMTVHLDPQDSLAIDFEQKVLSRLRRVVRDLTVVYVVPPETEEFGGTKGQYGLLEFDYASGKTQIGAIGERAVLQVLLSIAGAVYDPEAPSSYPGYPLDADASSSQLWFYFVLPLIVLAAWWMTNQGIKLSYGGKHGEMLQKS